MLRPITDVAKDLELSPDRLMPYGRWKAKIDLQTPSVDSKNPDGKLVLVTAMTPTPHGEGKTVNNL